MSSSEILTTAKAVAKPTERQTSPLTTLSPWQPVEPTTSATCKPCAAGATSKKSTTSTPASGVATAKKGWATPTTKTDLLTGLDIKG
jgi:hypothetical protein